MARPKTHFLRLLIVLILLIVAAAAAAPLVQFAPLKTAAEVKLSEMLGRKVTVESARLNLLTGPSLTLTGMTAQEDPDFGNDVFLKAESVRADFEVAEYVRSRRLVIRAMTLRSPQINLIKNANGVWSWTTIGKHQSDRSAISSLVSLVAHAISTLALLPAGSLSSTTLKSISVENASVRLIDHTAAAQSETLYRNIVLNASLAPNSTGDSAGSTHAIGRLVVQSEEDGQADLLKTTLPIDLQIDGGAGAALSAGGSIGPGPIETKNLTIGAVEVKGEIRSEPGTPLTGNGHISATDMFIRTINLSEQVARALKVDQIGDMNPGTKLASLDTDFQISKATFNTTDLRMQELDGLGDATAQTGSFKIEAALIVNYMATVTLSADATSRVKSSSPMLGIVVTVLETNNRLSVPININGDVRKPEIQVDVSRIF
jgi:uncharacterized protein involved in outer membrane biogenesis